MPKKALIINKRSRPLFRGEDLKIWAFAAKRRAAPKGSRDSTNSGMLPRYLGHLATYCLSVFCLSSIAGTIM